MNKNEFSEVNWINIVILKSFQGYFNVVELQGLSMLSKFARSKLNSTVFKSIRLLNQTKYLDGSFVEFFNSKSFDELNRIAYTDWNEIQKNLSIQKSTSDTNFELENIKRYANRLFIYGVKRSGHYFSPILSNFANLSVLKIHCCTIQYSIFQNIGEYFPNLKTFELYNVVLSKSSTDCTNSNEITFPLNLNNLGIRCVDVTDLSILSDPYKVVLNDYGYYARSKYTLPNISLPSLKKLEFIRCAAKNNGLDEFLEANPNLEQLHTDTFSPSMSKHFNSLKILDLEQVDKFENFENLVAHQSIKALKFSIEYCFNYEKFEKLCLMCPLVEFIRFHIFNIDSYQETFDKYLVPISQKLSNLKTLELPVYPDEPVWIDIDHFAQIEKVIFITEDVSHLAICFENNHNLQEIEFRATTRKIDKEEFLEKYGGYTEWKFKFYERKILGYKIL